MKKYIYLHKIFLAIYFFKFSDNYFFRQKDLAGTLDS